MKPRTKATIYVALAMMVPVTERLAVAVEKDAWPSVIQWAYCGASAVAAGLVTLKAWGSDPGKTGTGGQGNEGQRNEEGNQTS
jgi:hypothetical protein